MAFVRSKTIKGNEYLYLVKSVRNGDQVRQRVLEYLGPKESITKKDVPEEYRDEVSKEEDLGTTEEQAIKNQERYKDMFLEIASEEVYREPRNFQGIKENKDLRYAQFRQKGRLGNRKTWLEINPTTWQEMNDEEERKEVLKHEACHLVSMRHNQKFKRAAKRINAPMSYREVLGEPAKIQIKTKDNYYYQDYKEFDSREEAEKYLEENGNDILEETDAVKMRLKS